MTEREEDLLCLIEVIKNEVFLMGQTCFDAKVIGRYELAKLAREEGVQLEDLIEADFIGGYDQALEKTVERIENIIRLASERVRELTAPRVCEGD